MRSEINLFRWLVADFNRDGNPDLAVANQGDGDVTVLLGNGDGTFATPLSYAIGTYGNPSGVVSADFNGDGIPDLARLRPRRPGRQHPPRQRRWHVWHTFDISCGASPIQLVTADINGMAISTWSYPVRRKT